MIGRKEVSMFTVFANFVGESQSHCKSFRGVGLLGNRAVAIERKILTKQIIEETTLYIIYIIVELRFFIFSKSVRSLFSAPFCRYSTISSAITF